MNGKASRVLLPALLAGLLAGSALAQPIPKPEYVTYIPREPLAPVARTEANAAFHLFGDPQAPEFLDESPRDGMDDRRAAWFSELAVRFAPWMVRNAVGFPVDFRRFFDRGEPFPIFLDVFDLSATDPILLRTESADLAALRGRPCAGGDGSDTLPDCRLRRWIEQFGPVPTAASIRPPLAIPSDEDLAHVMYMDFPGRDPESWAKEYEGFEPGVAGRKYLGYAKTFVHPFIATVPGMLGAPPRYEFVLQYWFFYPFNDAGNVHEGDWEHLNVVVTPLAQGKEALSASLLERLIRGEIPADELVIQRVEYYFHHNVYVADYMTPSVYLPRAEWQAQLDALEPETFGEKGILAALRQHAYLDEEETQLNLHPVVYIGGNNKGLNDLLKMPSRLGRSSHGSYPFPGLYKDVGPAGTGESIPRKFLAFREPPPADAPESEPIVRYDNPERIQILPDWECVYPLTVSDPEVRRAWAWFVLPVRFGYPATVSPFSGIVKYAETGNLSVPAPNYNGGWNRLGDAAGYEIFAPHRLSALFPVSIQDTYITGWGFLNATLPTMLALPPFDVLGRVVTLPVHVTKVADRPTYFRRDDLPFRFISLTVGVSTFTPSVEFTNLFGFPELLYPLALELAADSTLGSGRDYVETDHSLYYQLGLHLGHRFTSENSIRHSKSLIGLDVYSPSRGRDVPLRGDLEMWEYAGSLRYSLSPGALQPYIKAGYGLSWYRIANATFDGQTLGPGESRWVRQPSIFPFEHLLPNTWHVGAGLEFIPVRHYGGFDLAARLEWQWFTHNLGLQAPDELLLVQDVRVYRNHFNAALTVSF